MKDGYTINMTYLLDEREVYYQACDQYGNGRVVGRARLLLNQQEITDLFVEPEHRRNGIATELVKRAESFARAAKLWRIFATTEIDNEASKALWVKDGYKLYHKYEKRLD